MDSAQKDAIRGRVAKLIERVRRQLDLERDRKVTDFDLLPTDLEAIATLLGLSIETEDDCGMIQSPGETLGAIYRSEKRIWIAGGKKHTRQRFTLAHELGHYVLHDQFVSFREVLPANDPGGHVRRTSTEQEADFFAAELLMPDYAVRKVFRGFFGGPIDGIHPNENVAFLLSRPPHSRYSATDLVRMGRTDRAKLFARIGTYAGIQFKPISDVFDVSVEAMALRLIELELVK